MWEELKNPERQKMGIGHFISRAAELHPERPAIEDLLNQRSLTYAELDARINRLGRALTQLGVKKGDFVASMLRNEHVLVETVFACARIGAIVAPLNVRLIAGEVAEYVADHGCRAAISDGDFTDRFADMGVALKIAFASRAIEGWHDYETLIASGNDAPLPAVTSLDDPYRLVMTGGTTGKSKGVLHSQGGSVITVLADIAEYGIGRGWQTLTILPGYHVAGMEWGMFTIFARAGTVVFPASASFDPDRYLAEIRKRKIEYLPLVPAVVNPLYDAWDREPLLSPQTVITTASPTPLPLREKLAAMFPEANIYAAAGLSESLNLATQGPGEFLEQPAAIGEPHLDTRVLILDENDRSVPRGTPGNVAMRNFNTALGYHRDDAAAATTWRPRPGDPEGLFWCFTGDIGVMDSDGRITLVDRSKDVVKTGGESVPSVEVESVYAAHAGVRDCAVIGVEDERWGEAILLIVVPEVATSKDRAFADELFDWGRGELSAFKVPKRIALVDDLPRSHFGKVLKRELREVEFDRVFYADAERRPE